MGSNDWFELACEIIAPLPPIPTHRFAPFLRLVRDAESEADIEAALAAEQMERLP